MNSKIFSTTSLLTVMLLSLTSISAYAEDVIIPRKKPENIEQLKKVREEAELYSDFPVIDGLMNNIMYKVKIPVAPKDVHGRNKNATESLNDVLEGFEGKYVGYFINKSECVAWINLYRISFAGGLRGGRGVVSCRLDKNGKMWGAPLNIYIGGISGGPQIGLDQVNYFLFFPNKETLLRVLEEFTIKTDLNVGATVAKWGTSASVGTDIVVSEGEIQDDAIYSYGDSKGAYLGLSLEGALLFSEDRYNSRSYGELTNQNILELPLNEAPKTLRGFSDRLNKFSKDPGPTMTELLKEKATDVATEAKEAIKEEIKDGVSAAINQAIENVTVTGDRK